MRKVYSLLFCVILGSGLFAQMANINEFHYDNSGTDEGEFVEVFIANPQPGDLSAYAVDLYNGSNGESYNSETLDNFTATAGSGGTYYVWMPSSIQNGGPDGIALSGPSGLIEFLSYEGTFASVGGPADGATSTDVGVEENSSTAIGQSLQKQPDGTWQLAAETPGAVNVAGSTDTVVEFVSASGTLSEGGVSFTVDVQIINPSATTATTVDVALNTSSTATNGVDYGDDMGMAIAFPVTLTFPADDMANQSIEIFIANDDTDVEGAETVLLDLQNPAGGSNVSLGSTAQFTLTISDNDSAGGAADARINEFHYDNMGADEGEFVEVYIANPQPSDLDSYNVTLYNGSTGSPYGSETLDNFAATPGTDGTYYVWMPNSIQNGSPDGLSLDYAGTVIEFLSYEGTFEATGGNAVGQTSVDIGVQQDGSNAIGTSMSYDDATMTWTFSSDDTPGAVNIITLGVNDFGISQDKLIVAIRGNQLFIQGIDAKSVEIYDINGRLVGDSTNLSGLSRGVYIARIVDANGQTVSKKFVK